MGKYNFDEKREPIGFFRDEINLDSFTWFIVEYVCREAVEVYAKSCTHALDVANSITGLCAKDIKNVKEGI